MLARIAAHWMTDGLMSQHGLNKREALIAILLFSLCMWPLVWELASAISYL
jgi:hypothetical protein